MAGPRAPLILLALAIVLTFVATPLLFVAWALAAGALAWLARAPNSRRAALVALAAMAAILLVALPLAGISVGFRGHALFRTEGADVAGAFASLSIVAAPIAGCVYLALAPAPRRARQLARAALIPFGLLLLVILAVARGEKIAGLMGLFGAATILLLVAAMGFALAGERGARPAPGSA